MYKVRKEAFKVAIERAENGKGQQFVVIDYEPNSPRKGYTVQSYMPPYCKFYGPIRSTNTDVYRHYFTDARLNVGGKPGEVIN